MRAVFAFIAVFATTTANISAFAQAQPQDSAQPEIGSQAAAAAVTQENPVICRPMIQNGYLTGRRECHTQRGWDTIRLRNQQEINNAQMRGFTSTPH